MVMWHVENILYLEMTNHQNQKVGFVGIQRLVLCWKLQSVTIKENTELRSESNSLSKDESRSWTRISDGLNRFVRDLTEKERVCENEQNTSTGTEKPVAKSKPKQVSAPSSSSTSTTVPIHLRKWIDVEPGTQNSRSYEVAKKRNTLLRHEPLPSEEDGAIESRRLKLEFASRFFNFPLIGQFDHGKVTWKGVGGHKKRFQYSVDPHVDAILYLRAIQGHSGGNPIDPSLQDNVMVPNDFLKYIYHVENSHDLHSIISSGLKQEEEMPKGNDRWYSLQPWIPRQCIFTSKESSRWPSPELLFTSKSGKCIRMRCTGLTQGLFKERDWLFTRRGQTRSFSTTFSHHSVLKKVVSMKSKEEIYDKVNHHVQRQRSPWEIIGKRMGNKMPQQAAAALNQSN